MKTCLKCGIEKDDSEFGWKVTGKYRQPNCKVCSRKYSRDHYYKNHDKHLKQARDRRVKYRKEVREFLFNYLSDKSCCDCGVSNPVVLDFDHVRGKKKFNLSMADRFASTMQAVVDEIAKCDIVCANCHRIRTAKRLNSRKYISFVAQSSVKTT